jgi:inner membrane protein
MDSVTHVALGAGVAAAVLGRRIGVRKAALLGGLLGTMPDLDVFIPRESPVDAFVLHRTGTHSLVMQVLAAPVVGEVVARVFSGLRDARMRAYLAVYLCFATHALVDGFTVYGTPLFWPLWREPLGLGSIFIIDPLYSLPLLVAMVWALFLPAWTPRFGRGLAVCLALSVAYLGWGAVAQRVVAARALAVLAGHGIVPERLLAVPTPFNSLYWRVIALDGERYLNLYGSVFGGADEMTVYAHPRGNGLAECLNGNRAYDTLAWFSRGFYRLEQRRGQIFVSDLRMGITPNYVFRYLVAEHGTQGVRALPPERHGEARSEDGDWGWLLAGLMNMPAPRPAEAAAALDMAALAPAPPEQSPAPSC